MACQSGAARHAGSFSEVFTARWREGPGPAATGTPPPKPCPPACPCAWLPAVQDGEVEAFMRLPVREVAHLMATTTDYKENCNLVIIDFLIRHGYLTPDMPGYLQLLAGLRSGDCS